MHTKNIERRQQIINYVNLYRSRAGVSPTVREIASGVGLSSVSTMHGYLQRMSRDGLIEYVPYEPRSIVVKSA